jgi:wyosine [tRNA(Phe)-imidazoG37] synthetase (radical SAM superfamily)
LPVDRRLHFPLSPALAAAGFVPYRTVVAEQPIAIRNSWNAVRDHARTYQDFTYVYPVISRRSRGLSIGVNLNPDKVCNFDCVYCEVDRKTPGKARTVDLAQVRDELLWLIDHAQSGGLAREAKFADAPPEVSREVRDIAFSGDGEPTMVHDFDACVRCVVDVLHERGLDRTKIVLITDAAGLDKASVKRGLELMDANRGEIWGKLDAGTEPYFRLVNRSAVKFERILSNLRETASARPIVIQSLFLRTHGEIMPAAELREYCARLNEIVAAGGRISEVHAYTIARPVPEPWATRLEPAELHALAETIRASTGLRVEEFP